MDATYIIIAVVLVLVIVGAIFGTVFSLRRRSERFHEQFGPEYEHTAAHAIAVKNKEHHTDTEELRQALIYYRSLFEELLETKAVAA